jgi:ATP-dependent Clp protease protease subunit
LRIGDNGAGHVDMPLSDFVYYSNHIAIISQGAPMSIQSQPRRFEEEEEDEPKAPVRRSEEALAEKFLKTRTILLTGQIDKEQGEKVIRQLLLLESLSVDPINLFIDSPGGDVDAGYAIFDMIRFIKAPVRILGMGLVASAAALILLAVPKERRLGLPNSHYLIHQPLSGIRGVATEIEIHARELEKTRERINKVIAEATGQSLERVQKDTDRDYWMSSEEALAYGLISRIGSGRDELGL